MKSRVIDGVEIHELTVGQIYDWLSEMVDREQRSDQSRTDPVDAVNRTLLPDCTLDDLARMSTLTVKQMRHLPPSSLALLARECQRMNPHFFRLAAGMATGTFPPLSDSEISAGSSPSSPAPDTPTS